MGRIRKLQLRKTNPNLVSLIDQLLEVSVKNEAKVWREVAEMLAKPRKQQAEVNVSKIDRYLKNGETAVVPGKVLGTGRVERALKVAALAFSENARRKIEEAGGKCMTLLQLANENPKGSGIRILK
ncbi:MAG: 50S ribosomal protein L18e [Archaeoglobus sp.]|nr:50S ribosomal protein L18e [Archaeoglobus sp.]